MIYPIEKIKKILQEISPWPWDMFKLPSHKFFTIISNDDVPIIESVITSLPITDKQYFSNTRLITESPQIISGLIEEVEHWQNLHTTAMEVQEVLKEKIKKQENEIERLRDQISNLYSHKMALDSIRCQLDYLKSKDIKIQDEYEYKITEGPRKMWNGSPDLSEDGWEKVNWERYDAHEEILWRKKK